MASYGGEFDNYGMYGLLGGAGQGMARGFEMLLGNQLETTRQERLAKLKHGQDLELEKEKAKLKPAAKGPAPKGFETGVVTGPDGKDYPYRFNKDTGAHEWIGQKPPIRSREEAEAMFEQMYGDRKLYFEGLRPEASAEAYEGYKDFDAMRGGMVNRMMTEESPFPTPQPYYKTPTFEEVKAGFQRQNRNYTDEQVQQYYDRRWGTQPGQEPAAPAPAPTPPYTEPSNYEGSLQGAPVERGAAGPMQKAGQAIEGAVDATTEAAGELTGYVRDKAAPYVQGLTDYFGGLNTKAQDDAANRVMNHVNAGGKIADLPTPVLTAASRSDKLSDDDRAKIRAALGWK